METLLILILLGGGGYLFLTSRAARNAETIRAHLFLAGRFAGDTVEMCNWTANVDIVNAPSELTTPVIRDAREHLAHDYDGQQLPMIKDAYGKGLVPRLPHWYRLLRGLS
jgi:hypothetical protein